MNANATMALVCYKYTTQWLELQAFRKIIVRHPHWRLDLRMEGRFWNCRPRQGGLLRMDTIAGPTRARRFWSNIQSVRRKPENNNVFVAKWRESWI
jgi:hypothetical protein